MNLFTQKLMALLVTAVVLGGASAGWAQSFFTQDFSDGIPSGWSTDGFTWISSGGINGKGAGLRVNLNSDNPTASVTVPGIVIGPNALLYYSFKATNYSDGSNAASGVLTHTITVANGYFNYNEGNYDQVGSGYAGNTSWWGLSDDSYITTRTVSTTIIFKWKSGDIYAYLDDIKVVGARYIVTYNPTGGTVSRTRDTTKTEARKLDSLPTPTRDRHAFNGWFAEETGGTQVTTSTVLSASATIYAQWTPIYRITFDGNGGSVSPSFGSTGVGGKLASIPTPTRLGYGFNGWFTSATGGDEVTVSTEFSGDATIYAQWIQNPYTVTFNANGGTVSPTSGTARSDGTIASLPTPTRAGYTFDGWYTAATGGEEVTEGTVYDANTTIYARWTLITYTITFDANGGSVSTESGTTGTGGRLTSLPTPTRTGYSFGGWYTAETSGTQVTTTTVFSEDATVYARWTEASSSVHTITFNANGGVVSPTSGTTGANGTLASLPTPTRDGYTFNGWYTAATGGTQVTAGRTYSANTTIYAQWTENGGAVTYTITFNANGGVVSPTSGTVGANGKLASLPTPTRDGYTFNGWYTAATGGSQVTTNTDFSVNAVIYAQWTAEPDAVASPDRVIPQSASSDVAAVAPVSALSAEFAAGPNPVGALRTTPVQFFRVGAAIKSANLSVYDASGNVVRKLAVSDKGSGGVRRVVGSWDLRDAKGRPVSEGTYLVRGTVTGRDGKRERVSLVVGVR